MDEILFTSSAARASLEVNNGASENNVTAKATENADKQVVVLPRDTDAGGVVSHKLTMKDTNYGDFKAETTAIDPETGTITFKYSGAKTGEKYHISVLVKDREYQDGKETASESLEKDGDFVYYGRIKDLEANPDASGTAQIELGDDIDLAGKTVYVYNEQYNGAKWTDYASNLVPIKIFVARADLNGGKTSGGDEYIDTFYYSGEDATAQLYKKDGKKLFDQDGKAFKEWNDKEAGDGTSYAEQAALFDDKGIQKNFVYYAQWKDAVDVSVTKKWVTDDGGKATDSVSVALYKDDSEIETVELSEKNKWTYVWEDLDTGSTYEVKEKNVPEGFNSKVESKDNDFTITNDDKGDVQKVVAKVITRITKTADESPLLFTLGVMLIALAIATAALKLRARHRE